MIDKGKVFAVDFDGTLYLGEDTPFPQVDETKMNMPLITYIQECQKNHPEDKYILWTCREGVQVEHALKAISKVSNIRWDAVNDNIQEIKLIYGNSRKIIADVYIDDKSQTPSIATMMLRKYSQEDNK